MVDPRFSGPPFLRAQNLLNLKVIMKKLSLIQCVLALPFIVSGCASITGSPNQNVSVQAREQNGVAVVGASCELTNDVGKWFVITPGSVGIHRSNKDLQVSCKKDGLEPGRAAVVSDTKGSMFGNILLGGGIGAIVDHNNGSAYEYPTVIDILMGSFTKIEIPKNQSNQQDKSQSDQANSAARQASANAPAGKISEPPIQISQQKLATVPSDTVSVIKPTNETTSQKLRDLQALRKDEIITEDEFQNKKKQLLEKI
jgi:hypothetical protein